MSLCLSFSGNGSIDVPAAVVITRDGPQSVIRPANAAEWLVVSSSYGITTPSYYWQMADATGNIVDDVEGNVMYVSGSPTYGNAFTGWNSKCVKIAAEVNAQGFGMPAASGGYDPTTQSVFILCYGSIVSSTSLGRNFLPMGAGLALTVGSTGIVRLQSNTNVTGSVDYRDSLIHPFVVEMIAGAGVTTHSGSGLYRLSTDKEQFTGSWEATNGTKGIGAAGLTITPAVSFFNALAWWVGAEAEALSTMGPKTFLQNFGWTVTGY